MGHRRGYTSRCRKEHFVGKNMLKEPNISADKAGMGEEIIDFVPFLMRWVAKEHAGNTPMKEFVMSAKRVASKCEAPKDPKIRI